MKSREVEEKYRHEMKYVASQRQLALIGMRLDRLAKLDAHAGDDGTYRIRSLYFDDFDNRCLEENMAGTDPREKFRIRIYNANPDKITLELKRKERGKTQKLACPLDREQCERLIRGQPLTWKAEYPPLLQKLLAQMHTRLMRPAVIVEYDRTPYVYRDGNVRVTMDRNISSSGAFGSFFKKEIPRRPVMEAGKHILEVKFDEFLPDTIKEAMELGTLRQTTFSKYYICRMYHL